MCAVFPRTTGCLGQIQYPRSNHRAQLRFPIVCLKLYESHIRVGSRPVRLSSLRFSIDTDFPAVYNLRLSDK